MTEAKKTAKSSKPKAESKKAVVRKRKEVEKIVDPGAPSSNEALEVKQTPDKVTDAVTEAVIVTNDDGLATEEQKSPVAKAGKRSAKAEKEQDEKTAKEDRKVSKTSATEAPKPIQKATRTKSERAGKKYREVVKLIDTDNTYTLADALELAIKTTTTKFDSSVELHIRLGVDPKQADQNIRGNVVLPAGSGKTVKIAVLCEPGDEKSATAAGADIVGAEKVFALLDKENFDFDMLIAAPSFMAKLGKYAKTLGPRGLMPNPKAGSVNADVAKAVKEAKAGKVEYRVDSTGIIHLSVGKVSFGGGKLDQNASAILDAVKAAKPSSLKGNYILSIFVATTMGPSIKVNL